MAWPQDAYVGQEVVCVDNADHSNGTRLPVSGHITLDAVYKIAAIAPAIGGSWDSGPVAFHLLGVVRASGMPFSAKRFRPAQKRNSSMELLQKLQDPTNHQQYLTDKFDRTRVPEPVKN